MICHQCGAEIKIGRYISRGDECSDCGSDVHSCLNCTNYDLAAHNHCREPQAEWVPDREKANFCDYFIPNALTVAAKKGGNGDALKAFDDLFKK